ncbi:MAG: formimidoylglutamase, partial [Actinobacteria bacterium]|nr:formimidoylglutamase [Actinomycetota bacterium]
MALPHDPLWPRASSLFSRETSTSSDVTVVGVPASRTSLSPTSAHETPDAIRNALLRYSTAHSDPRVSFEKLSLRDSGNTASPDSDENSVIAELRKLKIETAFLLALGGDNSITYAGFQGSDAT